MKVKVTNLTSNNGNAIPNQFKIRTNDGVYFQSYDSIIVFIPNNGKTQIGSDWDYSRTTGKYRNLFLRETKKETEAKIARGEYILNNEL